MFEEQVYSGFQRLHRNLEMNAFLWNEAQWNCLLSKQCAPSSSVICIKEAAGRGDSRGVESSGYVPLILRQGQ